MKLSRLRVTQTFTDLSFESKDSTFKIIMKRTTLTLQVSSLGFEIIAL